MTAETEIPSLPEAPWYDRPLISVFLLTAITVCLAAVLYLMISRMI